MKITLSPPGQRPSWLKDDDAVLARYYGGTRAVGARLASELETWGDAVSPAIEMIEIPDTHPYAVATSKGFTYWPGGRPPDDWDDAQEVLLRDGTTCPDDRVNFWGHLGYQSDIIGYHRKAEEAGKVWYAHMVVTDRPYICKPEESLAKLREQFGNNGQILALALSPTGKLLSAEVVQPPSRIDEIKAEMEALRAELERLEGGQ
jgi:hypothetical protein